VCGVVPAKFAVLLKLKLLRSVLLVLHRGVVALFTGLARKQNNVPHFLKLQSFYIHNKVVLFFHEKEKNQKKAVTRFSLSYFLFS
jgi:hypothetical protein